MSVRPHRRVAWIVAAVSCCLFPAGLPSIAARNDLDRFDLHGNVRTVVTKYSQMTTTHQFDHEGRLTILELHPVHQAGAVRYAYLHDWAGRLIEEETFEPDGALVSRKLYRYAMDDRDRPSARVAVTEEGTFAHVEFTFYDGRGLLSEEVMVTAQGVAEKSLFDARGNLLYHARYFHGRLVLEASHHYDPLDRLKESRFYASDGERMRTDRYGYDQAGHRVEQTSEYLHQSQLRKSIAVYESDQAGNWTKETMQRWPTKNGAAALTGTTVTRERIITYY
jgi:hypothetical protein